MTIPDFQTIMLPFLKFAGDGKEHSKRETTEYLAHAFHLTDAERRVLLPSGKQELFDNRVGWARTYLINAGLIFSTRWAYYKITDAGLAVLKQNPVKIDVNSLKKQPGFNDFVYSKTAHSEAVKEEQTTTPQEILAETAQKINNALASEILARLKLVSPKGFENIVVDLLIKMHYGSNFKDAIQALGKIGDEGVDGVINEDYLGLSRVYLQAKRYKDKSVGHPEIRDFIGALDLKHAERGIFITTSTFTKEVEDIKDRGSKRIILIDGNELARLMIANNVGVAIEETFELKRIDLDYFLEE
jgi:restriction system protein